MIISGVIVCEKCKRELQPDNILVGVGEKGNLIKRCCFCGHTIDVEEIGK